MHWVSFVTIIFLCWLGLLLLLLLLLFWFFNRAWRWLWTWLWFWLQTIILLSFRSFLMLLRILRLGRKLTRVPTSTTVLGRWVHHHWILWHRVLLLPIVAWLRHAWIIILFSHHNLEHLKLILLQLPHSRHLLLVHALRLMYRALMILRSPSRFLLGWCYRLRHWSGTESTLLPLHWGSFVPLMIFATRAPLTYHFEGWVVSIYVRPVMIDACFVPRTNFDDGWALVPVMVLTVGSIFTD